MAGANLSTLDAALRQTWTESRLADQLYNENPFLARIKRLKNTRVGKAALTPIHVSRNGGFTALPAGGGALNSAGNQGLAQASWTYKNFHQQVKVQGEAIDGTTNDTLSVVQAIDLEVSGALSDLNRQLTRMAYLNGDALVATCGTTTSSNTVVLDAVTGGNALNRGWIGVGSIIDIGTASNEVAVADAVTVTGVDPVNHTITISGSAVTTSSSHFVSIANSRSGATSFEMNGLKNLISTSTTVGGISPSSQTVWKAAAADNTSQALTLALMYSTNRTIMQQTGKPSNYVLTSLKQQEAFYKLVQSQVRFPGDQGLAAGNVDGVQFNGMTVYAYPDVQDECMYFLTIDDLLIVSAGDPYWQSKIDGGQTLVWNQGTDEYVGKLTTRLNFGLRRRNSQAVLSNLS